uniref:exopolyphosphatase PRUNE1 n=1 Tax=Myxine glutinosa TaxID=7769 RepID=UPI00358F338A
MKNMDFAAFIVESRKAIQAALLEGHEVSVVMGNEACDLDSAVAALTYAWFLFQFSRPGSRPVPMLNILRAELPLHPELGYLFKRLALPSIDYLPCQDDVQLKTLAKKGTLRLILVDHNILPLSDAELEQFVLEVIDHHRLERPQASRHSLSSRETVVYVEPVGSCCTLVAERILGLVPQASWMSLVPGNNHNEPQGRKQLSFNVAALLHATIVLDCVNLSPAAGKTTPKDRAVLETLEGLFPQLPSRSEIFEELLSIKSNIDGLNMEQLLHKDAKAVEVEGIRVELCTVYCTLETVLQRHGLEAELALHSETGSYNALILLTIVFNLKKTPQRGILLYTKDAALRTKLCLALENCHSPDLQLQIIRDLNGTNQYWVAYCQGTASASRKQLLPVVMDALADKASRGAIR